MTTAARLRLHWTCWQPTPYNDVLFEALAKMPSFDLMVHFRVPRVESHPWETRLGDRFSARMYQRILGVDRELLRRAVAEPDALFVVGGWEDRTAIVLLNLLMALGRRFAIWTDTPDLRRRPMFRQVPRSAWLRLVFRRARAVMGTGEPALRALRSMGCPTLKLNNLPYCVDLEMFRPANRPAAGPIVFASSGRLLVLKGYDLALKALASLYRDHPDRFIYRMAGSGLERERLGRLASDLGIAANVEFLEWLEPARLPEFYRTADVFLHPSRYEPYGVAVLEAMASGLVVVGSDATAAVLDRVSNGVSGFVHRTEDSGDLARAIAEATGSAPKMAAVKRAARATAEQWPVSRAVDTVAAVFLAAR